jgi:hypothetical protein
MSKAKEEYRDDLKRLRDQYEWYVKNAQTIGELVYPAAEYIKCLEKILNEVLER